MHVPFHYDDRLGIEIPTLTAPWDAYPRETQQEVLYRWEQSRGQIPKRISEIEMKINEKQNSLYEEMNFEQSCRLNREISELASVINDLWIWYRTGDDVEVKAPVKT